MWYRSRTAADLSISSSHLNMATIIHMAHPVFFSPIWSQKVARTNVLKTKSAGDILLFMPPRGCPGPPAPYFSCLFLHSSALCSHGSSSLVSLLLVKHPRSGPMWGFALAVPSARSSLPSGSITFISLTQQGFTWPSYLILQLTSPLSRPPIPSFYSTLSLLAPVTLYIPYNWPTCYAYCLLSVSSF